MTKQATIHKYINVSIFLLFLIVSICLIACSSAETKSTYDSEKAKRDQLLETYHLETGDIVFRKGLSIESQAVLLADSGGAYSHVGMVYKTDSGIYVIHIEPDSLKRTIDYAKFDSISVFFDPRFATIGCALRLKNEFKQFAHPAADSAKYYFSKKVSFDEKYNLKTIDKMYCTELIWKSYEVNNIQLIDTAINTIQIPLMGNKIILPSSIYNSPYLENIYYF